jgi:hypothetical protein
MWIRNFINKKKPIWGIFLKKLKIIIGSCYYIGIIRMSKYELELMMSMAFKKPANIN